uniref:Uncharacterized protein LOC104240880 n=1 Tax=Nicotiana sylvestris TaxID=4096 RepID=A0A1U7XWT8_NICSY|nr:PREDICTED: uncharacterized protein LOC104240880 [Nicotiana sylvestris]
MTDDEQKRLERFRRLWPPSFSGIESEDASGSLDSWCEAYQRRRLVGAAPLTWQEFSILFLDKFMLLSHKQELHRQFEQLHQDGMSIMQERIRRFINDLTYQLRLLMTQERVSGAIFDEVVDIARQIKMVRNQEQGDREAKRPRGSGGAASGGQSYHNRGYPYRNAQTARLVHRGASSGHGSYNTHQG